MRYLLLLLLPSVALATSKPPQNIADASSRSHAASYSDSYAKSGAYSGSEVSVSQGDLKAFGGHSESSNNVNIGDTTVKNGDAFGGHGGESHSDSAASIGDITNEGSSANAKGGHGGSASASGEGGSVGNITISSRGRSKIRNTPNAYAPSIQPSASCFKPGSGAASAPGIGLSIGGGKIDESCVRRELIRMGFQMGLVDQSNLLWCTEVMNLKTERRWWFGRKKALNVFESMEDCLQAAPDVVPPAYNDEVMIRLESVESVQMDAQASQSFLADEVAALRAELHKEKSRRVRDSKAAQEQRAKLDQFAKEHGVGG